MSRKVALKVLAVLLGVFLLLLCAGIILYLTIGPKAAPIQPHPSLNATTNKDCCRGRDGQCAEDPFLQLDQQPLHALAMSLGTGAFFDDWTNMTIATRYLHCVLSGEEGGFAPNASACCHQMKE
jgi:hypothetical protein